MSDGTGIEWTQATWNPTTGCDRVSAGCDNCYALTLARRLRAMGNPKYQNDGDPSTSGPGFALTLHADQLSLPHRWKSPRVIFVNSMSDLFHPEVPVEFIEDVFQVMADTPRHTYQVLTKRSKRLVALARRLPWPDNVWMGVSVESDQYCFRREALAVSVGGCSVRVGRAAAGPAGFHRPGRCRLAHRRRRVGPPCPSHAPSMGVRTPRQVRRGRCPVLLQAVGSLDAER